MFRLYYPKCLCGFVQSIYGRITSTRMRLKKIDSGLSLCWLQLQINDNLTASAENKTKINNEELIQSDLISHPQSQKGKTYMN